MSTPQISSKYGKYRIISINTIHFIILSLFFIFKTAKTSNISYSEWIVPTSPLAPRGGSGQAISYDTTSDTIWFLGGYSGDERRQLVSFKDNTFTDFGERNLSTTHNQVSGNSYYTQIDSYLYMIQIGGKLARFDLQDVTIQYAWNSITMAVDVRQKGCLASMSIDAGYLIVVGGDNTDLGYLNDVQILNLSSYKWLSNVPSMQQKRASFSCIVHSNKQLYAIGGIDGDGDLTTSVEVLSVSDLMNIESVEWNFIQNLTKRTIDSSAVTFGNDVIIIGGSGFGEKLDEIHVIDTSTNEVRVGGYLDAALFGVSPIVVNYVLYCFGGYRGSGGIYDTWRYMFLPSTGAPTSAPTSSPTLATFAPTYNPTYSPTIPTTNPTELTLDPTTTPTEITTNPTTSPSAEPTTEPTFEPTIDPTLAPSNTPSAPPSNFPSNAPTNAPTSLPSSAPTFAPTSAPSIPPTNAPTLSPTKSPTNAPTMVPTASPLSIGEIMSNIEINDGSSSTYWAYTVLGIGLFIALMVLVHSKAKCNVLNKICASACDDANFKSIILFVLQCFDLYSDILFCYTLHQYDANLSLVNVQLKHETFLSALFYASLIFIIVPYTLNIFGAMQITFDIARNDKISSFTKLYFEKRNKVYTTFVLCCGGAVAALELLNCKMFGLEMFNAGISHIELRRKYSKYRMLYTVGIENVPQLIIQTMFIVYFDRLTDAVILSCISSSISVVISLITFIMNQIGVTLTNNFDTVDMNILYTKFIDPKEYKKLVLYHGNEFEENKNLFVDRSLIDLNERNEMVSKLRLGSRHKLSSKFETFCECIVEWVATTIKTTNEYDANITGYYFTLKGGPKSFSESMEKSSNGLRNEIEKILKINESGIKMPYVYVIRIRTNDESNTVITGTQKQLMLQMTDAAQKTQHVPEEILTEWGLIEYWNVLKENGFEHVDDWKDLIQNTQQLQQYGFKEGHIKRFQRKYKEQYC